MKIGILLLSFLFINQIASGQSSDRVEAAFECLSVFQNVRDLTISQLGDEAYVTVQSLQGEISVLVRLIKSQGEWKVEGIAQFSGKYGDLEPFFSPDDLRLYFVSNRPLDESKLEIKDYDIWMVERKNVNAPWGIATNIGSEINTNDNEFYPSVAANGNLYFTSDRETTLGKDNLFVSRWNGKGYEAPEILSDAINTDGYEFNAFVAKDESFLIFSGYNRPDGAGSGDLYISHRDANNQWQNAINLGAEINSKQMDYCPFFDSKSNTLYFTSKRSDFDEINNFHSIAEVFTELNKSANGMSKIYKVTSIQFLNK
jgi:hypothetical protein